MFQVETSNFQTFRLSTFKLSSEGTEEASALLESITSNQPKNSSLEVVVSNSLLSSGRISTFRLSSQQSIMWQKQNNPVSYFKLKSSTFRLSTFKHSSFQQRNFQAGTVRCWEWNNLVLCDLLMLGSAQWATPPSSLIQFTQSDDWANFWRLSTSLKSFQSPF